MLKSRSPRLLTFALVLAALSLPSFGQKFTPDWTSLEQYKCPEWFRDAKLGVFLHWGPSSVADLVDGRGHAAPSRAARRAQRRP